MTEDGLDGLTLRIRLGSAIFVIEFEFIGSIGSQGLYGSVPPDPIKSGGGHLDSEERTCDTDYR